jgi:hypothetical protein
MREFPEFAASGRSGAGGGDWAGLPPRMPIGFGRSRHPSGRHKADRHRAYLTGFVVDRRLHPAFHAFFSIALVVIATVAAGIV